MQQRINYEEILYRAVKRSKPDWLDDKGKPTSAMFKDENGNSVDRDGERTLEEVVGFMNGGVFKGRLKGVVSLNAGECMSEPYAAEVVAAPSIENPYHANIYTCADNELISPLQALKLADISKVVYFDGFMKWVYL